MSESVDLSAVDALIAGAKRALALVEKTYDPGAMATLLDSATRALSTAHAIVGKAGERKLIGKG